MEELNRYLSATGADEQNFRNINVRSREHIVDLKNRTVTKQFYQKFKFEALEPFQTKTNVEFVNVRKYFLLVTFLVIELILAPNGDSELFDKQSLCGGSHLQKCGHEGFATYRLKSDPKVARGIKG